MKRITLKQNIQKQERIIITRAIILTMVLVFSILTMPFAARTVSAADMNEEGKTAAKAELDLEQGKEYHAYILFQAQNSWVYRGKFWEADKGPSSENWDRLFTSLNVTTPVVVDGKAEDAVIKGNGHYTVRLSGLNGSPMAGADNAEFGILGFSTDIPKNETIKFDNVNVRIDGNDKGTMTGDDVYYDKDDIEDPGLITVEVFNAWHEECKSLSLTLPNDSVEISFDVSGFQYDNPDPKVQGGNSLDEDQKDSIDQEASANPDDTGITTEDRKNNKSLPITIAIIIVIILVAGAFYLLMKRNKEE